MFNLFAPRAVPLRTLEKREIDGNQATGLLKIIALVFMFCDHAGKMLLPQVQEMRIIGRLAFPIYCWCLVVGFHYTRNVWIYLLRLLLVGVISQPLYVIALDHAWTDPNIMLSLAVALCGLIAIREKWMYSHIWGPVLALAAAVLLNCNYGWMGVMLVFLLYAAQEKRLGIAGVMLAFCLYWGWGPSPSRTITSVFGVKLSPQAMGAPWSTLLTPWLKQQTLAVLATPWLIIRMPKRLRIPTWVGYALYPGHLALLWWLEEILPGIVH